jgi:hypothetical protein
MTINIENEKDVKLIYDALILLKYFEYDFKIDNEIFTIKKINCLLINFLINNKKLCCLYSSIYEGNLSINDSIDTNITNYFMNVFYSEILNILEKEEIEKENNNKERNHEFYDIYNRWENKK